MACIDWQQTSHGAVLYLLYLLLCLSVYLSIYLSIYPHHNKYIMHITKVANGSEHAMQAHNTKEQQRKKHTKFTPSSNPALNAR
jgi:hypothetical protein